MSTSSFEQIRNLAADVLDVSASTLSPSSGPESVESWDSVQHLSLVLAVEQEFDLQFEPEEIEAMKTLGGITTCVDRKRSIS
jgi:acyl carrier protein